TLQIILDAREMHSPLEYLSHPTLSRIDTRASRLAFALQRRFRNNASWELGLPKQGDSQNDVPINGAGSRGSLVCASFGSRSAIGLRGAGRSLYIVGTRLCRAGCRKRTAALRRTGSCVRTGLCDARSCVRTGLCDAVCPRLSDAAARVPGACVLWSRIGLRPTAPLHRARTGLCVPLRGGIRTAAAGRPAL